MHGLRPIACHKSDLGGIGQCATAGAPMQPIHNLAPDSTSPVTMPNDGCWVCRPATASPLSGSNATAHTSGLIWGCSLSGSRHNSLRKAGHRGANHSAAALTEDTIATQMRPSAPVEMLSG
jgi:hypothetical protein